MKLLIFVLAVGATTSTTSAAGAEENKWVWGGESEEKASTKDDNRNLRYSVQEYPNDGPYQSGENYPSQNQFRPQYPGPYGPNSRPIGPGDGSQILVGPNGPGGRPFRPGGNGFDYNSGPVVPGVNIDPILSGPVPSWIRNDPRYQEYDSCKCSRGFNCPGLKFGSCARGKQYCCFSSRKYGGRPGYQQFNGNYPNRPSNSGGLPFRPFNAIPPEYYENGNNYEGGHNGNYYGNDQNYGRPYNNYNRPYYGNSGQYNGDYDGPFQGPYAPDYTGNYNPYNQGGNGFDWQNPYRRRPSYYDIDNYGRSGSAKGKNSKATNPSSDVPTKTKNN